MHIVTTLQASLVLGLFPILLVAQPCTGNLDVAGQAVQRGLTSEYAEGYLKNNTRFFSNTVQPLHSTESEFHFTSNSWNVDSICGTLHPDTFSTRFRGSLYIPQTGTYTFYLSSNGVSYLWLDNAALSYPCNIENALLINNTCANQLVQKTVALTAGYHNIQVQYASPMGQQALKLEYESTSLNIPRQIIPNKQFCTSIQPVIAPTPGCDGLNPDGSLPQNGLYADYFLNYFNGNQNFFVTDTAFLTRIDPTINYNTPSWQLSRASASSNPPSYSICWDGSIYIPVTGTYSFHLTSDNAAYMWLDDEAMMAMEHDMAPRTDRAVIANTNASGESTKTYTVHLTAGLHPMMLHYGVTSGTHRCQLLYSSDSLGIPMQVMPDYMFCSCMSTKKIIQHIPLSFFETTNTHLNEVKIRWALAPDANCATQYFVLERSKNGYDWELVKQLDPSASTSNNMYQHTDWVPWSGKTVYYRLRLIEQNGKMQASPVQVVELKNTNTAAYYLYPNPVVSNLTVATKEDAPIESIELFNTDGQKVQSILNKATLPLQLDLSNLPAGVYTLHLHSGAQVHSEQIVKN